MRKYQQYIAAGQEQEIFNGAGGQVVTLDPAVSVNVTIRDPDQGQEYRLTPGAVVRFDLPFDSLRAAHDGVGDTLITLYIGGPGSSAQSAQISGVVSLVRGQNMTATPVDVTTGNIGGAMLLAAANAARRRLVVLADSANTVAIRVGGSDVDATHGVPLAAGQSVEITGTAAVYCWDNALGQVFHFMAEYD